MAENESEALKQGEKIRLTSDKTIRLNHYSIGLSEWLEPCASCFIETRFGPF